MDQSLMAEPQRIGVPSIPSEESVGRIRLLMRHYFSTNFLWTAIHTCRLVQELEFADGPQPRFDMAHRSYAVTSVIASATFLDATVSEVFQDAHDGHGFEDDGYLAPLEPRAIELMQKVWRATRNGWNLSALEKWQWLLECCDHERLEGGSAPAQDASLLVRLRNALVHFKPEDVAADEEHELEKHLRSNFPGNQLMKDSGNPWWPDRALGYGCCEWAVGSARALADSVVNRIGISPNYARTEAAGWNGKVP